MVMNPCRSVTVQHAQTARHTQMHNQRTVREREDQVFASPFQMADLLPGDALRQIAGYRPAHVWVAYCGAHKTVSDAVGMQAATGDFDFGEFRHEENSHKNGSPPCCRNGYTPTSNVDKLPTFSDLFYIGQIVLQA